MTYVYPWEVTFGVNPPQEFCSVQQVYEYLDKQFRKHRRGCFEIVGRGARLAGSWELQIWESQCENAEKFEFFYDMTADDRGGLYTDCTRVES